MIFAWFLDRWMIISCALVLESINHLPYLWIDDICFASSKHTLTRHVGLEYLLASYFSNTWGINHLWLRQWLNSRIKSRDQQRCWSSWASIQMLALMMLIQLSINIILDSCDLASLDLNLISRFVQLTWVSRLILVNERRWGVDKV